LKKIGYKTIGLFEGDYWFKGATPTYDEFFPKTQNEQFQFFISAILIGEFRFDQQFNSLTQKEFVEIKED
jgi:hypothetical protein